MTKTKEPNMSTAIKYRCGHEFTYDIDFSKYSDGPEHLTRSFCSRCERNRLERKNVTTWALSDPVAVWESKSGRKIELRLTLKAGAEETEPYGPLDAFILPELVAKIDGHDIYCFSVPFYLYGENCPQDAPEGWYVQTTFRSGGLEPNGLFKVKTVTVYVTDQIDKIYNAITTEKTKMYRSDVFVQFMIEYERWRNSDASIT